MELDSEANKTRELLDQNNELLRVVGQKQLEIDLLNKLIELASKELGVDIKKNFFTQSSSGSGKMSPNTDIR